MQARVNNLPRVAVWQWNNREANKQPVLLLVQLPIAAPHHADTGMK